MAEVIDLSEYRKPAKTPRVDAPAPERGPSYYCTRCDTDWFRLNPSGLVHCASCGAVMRNILVTESTHQPKQGREP